MKKQIKKLSLNKKTISNLNLSEMSKRVGGSQKEYECGGKTMNNGMTCPGHKTCPYHATMCC